MASVEKKQVVKYNLELSQEELDSLTLVLRRVGGSFSTPRRFIDSIYEAIKDESRIIRSNNVFDDGVSLYFNEHTNNQKVRDLLYKEE